MVIKDVDLNPLADFFLKEFSKSCAGVIVLNNIKFNTNNLPGIFDGIEDGFKYLFAASQETDMILLSKRQA